MTPDELAAWASLAGQVSGNGLLILAIVGLIKGWVVTSRHLEDVLEAKDEYIAYLERKVANLQNGTRN